jgi:CheY-like chemotaxis protein
MDTEVLVMVVEDDLLLMKAIVTKLEKVGKKVVAFSSAEEALEYLRYNQRLPDVIWLDYYLKDMNGMQFMGKLKENDNWARIPVMVVSNSASHEKVAKMMELGVKKYILKAESRLEDLLQVLEDIKERR